MTGGDRNLEVGQGLAWRAIVVVGAAAITITVASLTAAAMPDGDGKVVSALRGVVVAAVAAASAYGSAWGLRRALAMAGVPTDGPLVSERIDRSKKAQAAAVLAVGLLLGLLGAGIDGTLDPDGGDSDVASTDGSDLTASNRDGGSETSRGAGADSDDDGDGSTVGDAPDRRRADGDASKGRGGSGGTGTGTGDDDDGTNPGDDDDDCTTCVGGDDDDGGGLIDEVCDALSDTPTVTSTTVTVPLDEACDTLDEAVQDLCEALGQAACETFEDTLDDVKTTVTTVVDTVSTTPTTVPTLPTTPTTPTTLPVDDVVDDLLGGVLF